MGLKSGLEFFGALQDQLWESMSNNQHYSGSEESWKLFAGMSHFAFERAEF
jgi:hypothetical protein